MSGTGELVQMQMQVQNLIGFNRPRKPTISGIVRFRQTQTYQAEGRSTVNPFEYSLLNNPSDKGEKSDKTINALINNIKNHVIKAIVSDLYLEIQSIQATEKNLEFKNYLIVCLLAQVAEDICHVEFLGLSPALNNSLKSVLPKKLSEIIVQYSLGDPDAVPQILQTLEQISLILGLN